MAWTQDDLAKLDRAIATGAKKVRFQTHEAEYHSVAEMLKVRDLIKAELDPANAPGGVLFTQYEGGL